MHLLTGDSGSCVGAGCGLTGFVRVGLIMAAICCDLPLCETAMVRRACFGMFVAMAELFVIFHD